MTLMPPTVSLSKHFVIHEERSSPCQGGNKFCTSYLNQCVCVFRFTQLLFSVISSRMHLTWIERYLYKCVCIQFMIILVYLTCNTIYIKPFAVARVLLGQGPSLSWEVCKIKQINIAFNHKSIFRLRVSTIVGRMIKWGWHWTSGGVKMVNYNCPLLLFTSCKSLRPGKSCHRPSSSCLSEVKLITRRDGRGDGTGKNQIAFRALQWARVPCLDAPPP